MNKRRHCAAILNYGRFIVNAAAKTGIPVVLAVELPPDGASVRQIAEARIIKEIMNGTS